MAMYSTTVILSTYIIVLPPLHHPYTLLWPTPPPTPEFQPGDMVLVDASNIRVNRPNQKLASLRLGPFKVLEVVGSGAY